MIQAYSAQQIRDAEAPLLAAGVPLMQRAAAGLAREIENALAASAISRAGVLLLVGSGNNGGDALWAGERLARAGHRVTIFPVGGRLHAEGLEAARAAGARLVRDEDRTPEEAARLAGASQLVVDGILGTGAAASPALRGRARDVVKALAPNLPGRCLVVAVDLPSGVDSDDGSVPEPVVLPADVTVTFGAHKAGLLREPAAGFVGRLVLVDIGLAPGLVGVEPVLTVSEPAGGGGG